MHPDLLLQPDPHQMIPTVDDFAVARLRLDCEWCVSDHDNHNVLTLTSDNLCGTVRKSPSWHDVDRYDNKPDPSNSPTRLQCLRRSVDDSQNRKLKSNHQQSIKTVKQTLKCKKSKHIHKHTLPQTYKRLCFTIRHRHKSEKPNTYAKSQHVFLFRRRVSLVE